MPRSIWAGLAKPHVVSMSLVLSCPRVSERGLSSIMRSWMHRLCQLVTRSLSPDEQVQSGLMLPLASVCERARECV